MKRIIRIMGLCALVALAATACKKEAQTTSSFKATLTQPTSDAKTGINNNLQLVWNEGDQIKVFDNNGEEYIFTTNDNGTTTATFTGTELDASASYVAFYPAENASIDGNIIKLGINANQTYAPNSFAAGTYPMVAKSEAGNLAFTFTSDCGLLAIPVKGSGSIGSIELTGKADEDLAGQLQYTIGGDFNYYDSSSKKVTLNCGGVGLGTDPKVFYFVLPSGVLHSGFTAVLKDIMGGELGTLSTDNNNTIEDQTVRMMPAVTVGQTGMVINVDTPQTSSATPNQCTLTGSVTYDPGVVLDEVGFYYGTASKGLNELPANLTNKVTLENVPASGASFSYTLTGLAENTAYQYCVYVKTGDQEIYGGLESFSTPAFNPLTTPLTFEARVANVSVGFGGSAFAAPALEYSKNGGEWTSFPGQITLENVGDIVSFRGNNSSTVENQFSCSGQCYIYGNVMSLLHAEDYATNYTLTSSAFTGLFYNNSNINIPTNKDLVLPATTLAPYCYREMFRGCESLTKAPALPAETLTDYCYDRMFMGCTSLTTAPELPATTLANNCYRYMFRGCASLTTAPELPATTLASSCYSNMFLFCASLTTAPELPATTLASSCYSGMFQGCTSLTTAPELPAETLTNSCYSSMFRGCSQLSSITCLATSGVNEENTDSWVDGVASTGTFTKASNAWSTGFNGIPSNWDVVSLVPDYVFSVSETTTVHFSSGNLYYDGSSWGFESTPQYSQYNNGGYINVFRWGANGNTAAPNHGVDIYTESAYCDIESGVLGDYGADWGQVVGELDGATGWRTLTSDEWNYIRTNGHYGLATVNGYKGLILLPDDSEVTINEDHSSYSNNQITELEWNSNYKPLGVVFLPAAGSIGPMYDDPGTGVYWSSSRRYYSGGLNAGYRCFSFIFRDEHGPNYNVSLLVSEDGNHGQSVRLVR